MDVINFVTSPSGAPVKQQGDALGNVTSVPVTGSVQRVSAGFLSPGQTAKSYIGSVVTPATCAQPAAPTVAINAVAGNLTGTYTWKVTFVSANGESQGGITSSPLTITAQQANLTAIPLGPTGTTQRKIYRVTAGGLDGTQKLVATIADNTTTTYTDNIADGALGVQTPVRNSWAAALSVALGAVTAGKLWLATDIFFSTDAPAPVDIQLQAAGSTIFRKLIQLTAPFDGAGIETQPNGAAGNALALLMQGTPLPQTVVYDIEAIEQ